MLITYLFQEIICCVKFIKITFLILHSPVLHFISLSFSVESISSFSCIYIVIVLLNFQEGIGQSRKNSWPICFFLTEIASF